MNDSEREQLRRQMQRMTQAWSAVAVAVRADIQRVADGLKVFSRTPAWLDLRMSTGGYEEDLAESHGDTEDVWV